MHTIKTSIDFDHENKNCDHLSTKIIEIKKLNSVIPRESQKRAAESHRKPGRATERARGSQREPEGAKESQR